MPLSLAFWILAFLWLVFGLWTAGPNNFKSFGGTILLFVLLVLVGWRVFGPPLHS